MRPSSLTLNRRPFFLGSDLLDRRDFAESDSAKVVRKQSWYKSTKETVTNKIAMSDTRHNAHAGIAMLQERINEPRTFKSVPTNNTLDINSIIAKIMGRTSLPEEILYVLYAHETAIKRLATSVPDDEDSTDYSKYSSFELPARCKAYPPLVFDSLDSTWSQAYAKRAIGNPKFKSELQGATILLNAGVWT